MADTCTNNYNKFSNFHLISYEIIKYLMDHEDILWKLLKYESADAWNKPNLTKIEKGALIYDGSPNETNYRVFMDVGADNSWTQQSCILRVSPISMIPSNYVFGYVTVGLEIYSHYLINHLSNYTTRTDYGSQRLIETLNGAEIDNLGRLYFDSSASRECKSIIMGSIPYKGRAVVMSNHALG